MESPDLVGRSRGSGFDTLGDSFPLSGPQFTDLRCV